MAAAAGPPPLFRYVFPPLASLDPIRAPRDALRLACVAMHSIGMDRIVAQKDRAVFHVDVVDRAVVLMIPAWLVDQLARKFASAMTPSWLAAWLASKFSSFDAFADKLRLHMQPCCTDPTLRIHIVADLAHGVFATDRMLPCIKAMHHGHATTLLAHAMPGVIAFNETWGDWDITRPSRVLTREQLLDPPAQSILTDAGFRELLATMEYFRGATEEEWTFTHGPSADERYDMWSPKYHLRDICEKEAAVVGRLTASSQERVANARKQIKALDVVRKRLARHLVNANPRIFIDMRTDPVCPWKGLRLFHGTDFRELQSGVDAEAGAGSSGTHAPCKLAWDEYVNDQDEAVNRTAFVTPYYAKSVSYGRHVHTYELSAEGASLRMLDLRNDYVASTHKHDELDPFKPIYELAGIEHGGRNRVEKAVDLYHLFKDSGVDGLVLNADVEWIFFDAASVLDWVAPTPASDFIALLLNTTDTVECEPLCANAIEYVTRVFECITAGDLLAFLDACGGAVDLSLSSLPITRWTMDTDDDPYMAQFAAGAAAAGMSRLWNSFQLPALYDDLVQLRVYECEYHALWRFIHPPFDNMWMGDVIREGGEARRTALPYHQLVAKLRGMKITLLVHLPSGHTQLVPPIQQPNSQYDRRMYIVDPSTADLVDMPVRDVYRPRAAAAAASSSSSSSKRHGAGDDGHAKKPRSSSSGKLCIC